MLEVLHVRGVWRRWMRGRYENIQQLFLILLIADEKMLWPEKECRQPFCVLRIVILGQTGQYD